MFLIIIASKDGFIIMVRTTLDSWVRHEGISFSMDSSETLNAAIDKVIASLADPVEILGFGETLHGGEDILMLRNKFFQYLVQKHGFSAIAIESSFTRGCIVNDYITGQSPTSYETVQNTGFSHSFGQLAANYELVEWMREYNADASHPLKLHFYGFDMPLLKMGVASPSQVLHFVLTYLASIDDANTQEHRQRIDSLLGPDSEWENVAALSDPTKSIGLSPAATALRIETEDLHTELQIHRPELVAKSGRDRYLEAIHYVSIARQLLNYHAAMAQKSNYSTVQGIRGALMADNLAYIVERERGRGKILVFAHSSHLKRGKAVWPWYTFWPVGSHLHEVFGQRYAVISTAVGVSDANGIGLPENGSLEAKLATLPGPAVFIPTHKGQGLPVTEINALPIRSGSMKNNSYMPLGPQSFTDFDWLAFLGSTSYIRGGRPLQ